VPEIEPAGRSRFVSVRDHTLHYVEYGKPDRRDVIAMVQRGSRAAVCQLTNAFLHRAEEQEPVLKFLN